MAGCVSPQAILSALVTRAERDGHAPTLKETTSLLALGCAPDEITERFSRTPEDVRARIAELLALAAAS